MSESSTNGTYVSECNLKYAETKVPVALTDKSALRQYWRKAGRVVVHADF